MKKRIEKEVLEFEGLCSWLADKTDQVYAISLEEDLDLRNYSLKVIATPKDKTYEEMSKEELIEIINELKAKSNGKTRTN